MEAASVAAREAEDSDESRTNKLVLLLTVRAFFIKVRTFFVLAADILQKVRHTLHGYGLLLAQV